MMVFADEPKFKMTFFATSSIAVLELSIDTTSLALIVQSINRKTTAVTISV
jgi:hypothetical protein